METRRSLRSILRDNQTTDNVSTIVPSGSVDRSFLLGRACFAYELPCGLPLLVIRRTLDRDPREHLLFDAHTVFFFRVDGSSHFFIRSRSSTTQLSYCYFHHSLQHLHSSLLTVTGQKTVLLVSESLLSPKPKKDVQRRCCH